MVLFLLFMFCVCHVFLSIHCRLVVTCWERADLLALLYVMFYCVFVTFPCGILGKVWRLIVSILDLCLLFYFYSVEIWNNIGAGHTMRMRRLICAFFCLHMPWFK